MKKKITIDGVSYVIEKENYTLDDLKQKLINDLYNAGFPSEEQIKLLEILLQY